MPLACGPAASRYRAAGPCRAGVGTPVAESADAREAPSRRKARAYSQSPAHVQSRARPGSAPVSARSGRLAADDLEVLGQKPVSSSRARPKQRLSPSVSVPKGPQPAPPVRLSFKLSGSGCDVGEMLTTVWDAQVRLAFRLFGCGRDVGDTLAKV
ncbi:unnamed protein product [Polarella glacialis]|uniref:Uncharacterized protein n=1 Tax=Polarella glacialis TaxID=89957 RepID=A0A813DD50_POLGL|nr:unnamed protein product [Polarella glacialis]